MVVFAIEVEQSRIHILTNGPKNGSKGDYGILSQYAAPPFSHKYQVCLILENARSAAPILRFCWTFFHIPRYIPKMKRQQGYKYRLNLPSGAATRLSQQAGCVRVVWNRATAMSKDKYPGNAALSALLPAWKKELPWLADSDSIALQQSLRNFDRAWQNFFAYPESFARPTFKKRGDRDSFRIVGAAATKTQFSKVWLPKFGWLHFRASRPWQGTVKSVTFSRKAGKWYVSILTEREVTAPALRQDDWLGIDVGIAQYATLSTGEHKPSICALRRAQKRLTKLSRKLARATKGSRRRKSTKLRLAACHAQIANKRADHAHKVSSEIVTKHGRIRMEDLRLINMMKSAKGTIEMPGKNVAQKRGLSRHLADQGLRQLRTFLAYKLAWSNGVLEAVDPKYTSQKCHACKHTARDNRVSQAAFKCTACGHSDHADVNAAKNIRDTTAVGTIAVKVPPRRRRKSPACDVHIPSAA
jgi:putative transposase